MASVRSEVLDWSAAASMTPGADGGEEVRLWGGRVAGWQGLEQEARGEARGARGEGPKSQRANAQGGGRAVGRAARAALRVQIRR